MPGGNPTTTQMQSTTSSPWAPTQGALQGIIGGIAGLPTSVTPGQTSALAALQGGAAGVPNFAPQGTNSIDSLFAGGNANASAPILSGAYDSLRRSLAPLADPNNLNPTNTPGFSTAIKTMGNDITNSINDQFAASGRDLSPGHTTALARGLSQGEGGLIANQYNANVAGLEGAANSTFAGGNAAATGLTNFNQLGNTNQLAALMGAATIPGLSMAPGAAAMSAANAGFGMPFANLGTAESLLTPLAALGGQSNGTGTLQTQIPGWQQALGGAAGLGSLFSAPAGGTSAISGLMSLFPFLA